MIFSIRHVDKILEVVADGTNQIPDRLIPDKLKSVLRQKKLVIHRELLIPIPELKPNREVVEYGKDEAYICVSGSGRTMNSQAGFS